MTRSGSQGDSQTKATAKAAPATSSSQDLQAAYQCHTLAQLVFGQLATAYPWLAAAPHPPGAPPRPRPAGGQASH